MVDNGHNKFDKQQERVKNASFCGGKCFIPLELLCCCEREERNGFVTAYVYQRTRNLGVFSIQIRKKEEEGYRCEISKEPGRRLCLEVAVSRLKERIQVCYCVGRTRNGQ